MSVYYVITAYNDGSPTVLHSATNGEVRVRDASLVEEKNAIPSLTFAIYPNNPGYSILTEFATFIRVQRIADGSSENIFDGRVLTNTPGFDSDGTIHREIVCEGALGYLCDSVQPYLKEQLWVDDEDSTGLQKYVQHLLDTHNASVEDYKHIYPGVIDCTTYKSTDQVYKGTNWQNTWEVVKEKLIGAFGGEVQVVRGTDNLLYLNYRDEIGSPTVDAQPLKLGKNLSSGLSEPQPENVITRLYPLGAKLETTYIDDDGVEVTEETEERLTIESVYDTPYIDDIDAMAIFGVIEGTHTWDGVTTASNLLSKAGTWLTENNAFPVSITLDAYDLSLLGYDYDTFRLYNCYYVDADILDVSRNAAQYLEVVKKTTDISEPHKSTIELGDVTRLASRSTVKAELMQEIESVRKTSSLHFANAVTYTNSALELYDTQIQSTVSELTTVYYVDDEGNTHSVPVSEIYSLITQTSDGVGLELVEKTQELSDVTSDLSLTLAELLAYVRVEMDDDGQPVLRLGSNTSNLVAALTNSELGFYDSNVLVSYISDQKMYISNAEITNELDFGNWAWFARDNGNMTLKWMGA